MNLTFVRFAPFCGCVKFRLFDPIAETIYVRHNFNAIVIAESDSGPPDVRIPRADPVALRIQNMGAFVVVGCIENIGPDPVDHFFELVGVRFDFTPHSRFHIVAAIDSNNDIRLVGSTVIKVLVVGIDRVVVKCLGYLGIALETPVTSSTANGYHGQNQSKNRSPVSEMSIIFIFGADPVHDKSSIVAVKLNTVYAY